ncbi:NAD(P)-dependent oxidoreductase [Parasedimentitalea maritima]|uniref:NAD(P)-dependent oxidoreductase n=1 Tax=Parasedimentitalea maritima TaxID=2578117 RepID=A0ABY2US94_9RHOB|nr:NAD(P)-dependent oxidoreductase [Zongyanglinia marina]TLP54976.1 NAD(P)-dependent oxidoreductase [Zongyanglinia marina]
MVFPQVLVLGASGRIGRVLRHCWPGSADLHWQTRRAQGEDGTGQGWRIFDPLGDSAALVAAAQGVDAILCLAGAVPGRNNAMEDNMRLGEAAVRAGATTGAQVFLASSAAVYGGRPGLLPEEVPLLATTPYGVSKAEMEQQAARLGVDLNVRVCALRIGNIAGLDAILGGWRPGFQLDVFGDNRTPRRSYIGAGILARVLADLMPLQDLPSALNIAQPGAIEMGDLLQAAGLDYDHRPAPEGALPEVALDVSRLNALLPADHQLPATDPAQMVAEWRALGLE